jgi:hypothetical protein
MEGSVQFAYNNLDEVLCTPQRLCLFREYCCQHYAEVWLRRLSLANKENVDFIACVNVYESTVRRLAQ